ncbi:hypothetical protein MycrhN_4410 [Mycolicibacterium rhodesiae NBB3]|uniref:Uncharacterized protein n=1 Tax=Mycolicibacterium rhodesiae (strain NBB3) TaxID=710685 RepID=G8RLT1_MYCRN|nr:hypothetical protein [Mycolicibacterium rhodesiae]AEV74904.1 hypothetical protein MycrhN_4410 [Mycolicibacterium rhodesiae NBB3]
MDSADKSASSNDDAAVWGGVGPKPWWFDDPEIVAARRKVLEEFGGEPDESAVSDEPEPEVSDIAASSNDDADLSDGVWGGVGPKPWWFDDPEPDAILNDMLSGASVRELCQARDDLARAQARYDEAIRSARICGLSWGEIGAALGVARQLLHRRYARRLGSRRGPIER